MVRRIALKQKLTPSNNRMLSFWANWNNWNWNFKQFFNHSQIFFSVIRQLVIISYFACVIPPAIKLFINWLAVLKRFNFCGKMSKTTRHRRVAWWAESLDSHPVHRRWFLSISKMPCIFDDHHKSMIYEMLRIFLNIFWQSILPLVKCQKCTAFLSTLGNFQFPMN